jgi:hypothetical protein
MVKRSQRKIVALKIVKISIALSGTLSPLYAGELLRNSAPQSSILTNYSILSNSPIALVSTTINNHIHPSTQFTSSDFQAEACYALPQSSDIAMLSLAELPAAAAQLMQARADLIQDCQEFSCTSQQAAVRAREIALLQDAIMSRYAALTPQYNTQTLFANTMKKNQFQTVQAAESYYQAMRATYVNAGGDLARIAPLSAAYLAAAPHGCLMDWVVDENNEVYAAIVNEDSVQNPGHTLLAKGRPVRSAGTLRLFRRPNASKPYLVLVSAFSGHYRSTLDSVERTLVPILQELGIAHSSIVVERGDIGSGDLLETLYRAQGLNDTATVEQIGNLRRLTRLREQGAFAGAHRARNTAAMDFRSIAMNLFQEDYLTQNPQRSPVDVGLRGRIYANTTASDPRQWSAIAAGTFTQMSAAKQLAKTPYLSWFVEDEGKLSSRAPHFIAEEFSSIKSRLLRAAGGFANRGNSSGLADLVGAELAQELTAEGYALETLQRQDAANPQDPSQWPGRQYYDLYYDDAKETCYNQGVTLRVRYVNVPAEERLNGSGPGKLTVKIGAPSSAESGSAIWHRLEVKFSLGKDVPMRYFLAQGNNAVPDSLNPIAYLAAHSGLERTSLRPMVAIVDSRYELLLNKADGTPLYLITLDEVRVEDPHTAPSASAGQSPSFFELEVERVNASDLPEDKAALDRFIDQLASQLNLKASSKNKAMRGYEILTQR